MGDEKKGPGFVVKDKRIFAEGNEDTGKKDASPDVEPEPKAREDIKNQNQEEECDYPPITFTNFVLSLSTSALFHFGDFPDPAGGKSEKNLPAAKQTIDILDVISEKTKGNLNEQESQLIQGVLYELKLRYVKEKS
jgi:hypothetical protein